MTICFDTYWQMDNLPKDLSETIRTNLSRLLSQRGWTQAQLADMADVEPATVNRALSGKLRMVTDSFTKIASALGVEPGDIMSERTNVEPVRLNGRLVPVLDYIQAGVFAGVAPHFREEEMTEFIPTMGGHSENTFALRIRGESMMPEFRENDVVVIDPEIAPQPEDFVVGKDSGGEATFKRYHRRGVDPNTGNIRFDLVPLNSAYETLHSTEQHIEIVGTMVEHHRYRRR